jgi:2'-5' RNA ligase
MNYFFAVQPSEEAREKLAEQARMWKWMLGSLTKPLASRWYDPSDYHVTLKFLGGLAELDDAIILAGLTAAEKAAPFTLTINGMGAFPDLARPRVLWLGVAENLDLSKLTASLEAEAASCGLPRETRPYLPHLTVARSAPPQHPKWVHVPIAKERTFAEFPVDCFVLMQTLPPESRTNETKARYNLVHTFPFGRPPEGQGDSIE